MQESKITPKSDFSAVADPAQSYDLARMIEIAFMSAMDQDCQIELPRAQVAGNEEEGFTLRLSSDNPLDRDEQMGLLELDQYVSDSIPDLVAGGYPVEYDIHERILSTPNVEVLIAVLSEMTRFTRDPAITVPELLEVQSKGASAPAMRLN